MQAALFRFFAPWKILSASWWKAEAFLWETERGQFEVFRFFAFRCAFFC